MKTQTAFLATLAISAATACVVHAEGQIDMTGNGTSAGVNRRVMTTPSYVRVQGHFQVTDFNVPKKPSGGYWSASTPMGVVSSCPTFYLGAQQSGHQPAEAGLQFESPSKANPDELAGWRIFMRWHGYGPDKDTRAVGSNNDIWINLWLPDGSGSFVTWRSTEEQISADLDFSAQPDGTASLRLGSFVTSASPQELLFNRI